MGVLAGIGVLAAALSRPARKPAPRPVAAEDLLRQAKEEGAREERERAARERNNTHHERAERAA